MVDDCSTDGTRELIKSKLLNRVDKVIFHNKNRGKGACIISSQKYICGDLVIIQDADLEYDPYDLTRIINLFSKDSNIDVIYGSRVLNKKNYSNLTFEKKFRVFANFILTSINNLFNKQNLTDAHTCYKIFSKKIFSKLHLYEKRFAICSEINTKLSKLNIKIMEVPIKYKGRGYDENKKIGLKDAFDSLKAIIKYNYFTQSIKKKSVNKII